MKIIDDFSEAVQMPHPERMARGYANPIAASAPLHFD